MLYFDSYCGSLRGAWQTTGIKGPNKTRVLLRKCSGYREMKFVLMIEVDLFY